MAISKLILNGDVQMDVTSDTVSANRMLNGYTATKNDGTKVTGNIATKSAADMTASGATVTAPAGYYASSASKSISNGTQGTPSFNRSTGTNSTTLTPVVVNSAGYINGGTKTGTAVTISASQLVSGTKSITSNGTGIDVTNYANVDVDVSVTPYSAIAVSPNFDGGFYLPNSKVYVTSMLIVSDEDWEEKYETDVLMTSSSISYSTSTHESTAIVNLSDSMSNGKGFFCIIEVLYGESQNDYIWLWSDNITIGTTQLSFQSMLDFAIVKRASFTSANTLQIVFDWQNAYQGVNEVTDFFGDKFSSGVTINEDLVGCRGVIVYPPSGTIQITENGSYNVKWRETAEVNVNAVSPLWLKATLVNNTSSDVYIGDIIDGFNNCYALSDGYYLCKSGEGGSPIDSYVLANSTKTLYFAYGAGSLYISSTVAGSSHFSNVVNLSPIYDQYYTELGVTDDSKSSSFTLTIS